MLFRSINVTSEQGRICHAYLKAREFQFPKFTGEEREFYAIGKSARDAWKNLYLKVAETAPIGIHYRFDGFRTLYGKYERAIA